MSKETATAQVLYPLGSILQEIGLATLFPSTQPLEIELGSGDGSFLVAHALANPQRNFIGIERLLGRIRKLERRAVKAGLTNLRGIRIESAYFLKYLLPPHCVQALHIYFPDPWPKRKHERHRLIREGFPDLARRILAQQGVVYLRTDDAPYFDQMSRVFLSSPHFKAVETPGSLLELLTDFERDFIARGIETRRAAFQLLSPPVA